MYCDTAKLPLPLTPYPLPLPLLQTINNNQSLQNQRHLTEVHIFM